MKNYIKSFWQKNNEPVQQIVSPDPVPNGVLISPDGINWRTVNVAPPMNRCVATEQKSEKYRKKSK